MKVAISEVFYSLQGEGKTTGVPSVFVRLGGCNLMCGGQGTQFDKELHNGATWRCDTIEVWMNALGKSVDEILPDDCIEAIKNGAHLILTGGEPTLQAKALNEFIKYVMTEINPEVYIEVETNGTNSPNLEHIDQWNCSPKLSNSGNEKSVRYRPEVLKELNELNTQFKFVISGEEDLKEIHEEFSFLNPRKIWLMPAGENQLLLNPIKTIVAELAKKYFYNFTTRLHIDLWDRKTGV
jgi:organic radical activating enzyme